MRSHPIESQALRANRSPRIQRYRRVAVRVDVRISTIDPETDPTTGIPYFRTSEETCANVSRGGAYVETSEIVSPGRRLLVELQLPDGDRIQAVGRVAWSKVRALDGEPRNGMGIEFVGASSEELNRLEAFIDRELPAPVGGATTRG
jgi:Tfp pilus assembly protein PilZ